MNAPITLEQFIFGILTVLIPTLGTQLYNMWKANKDAKINAPLTKAQVESANGQALTQLGQVYQQALSTIESQDTELATLRPLILQIAIMRQQCDQTDKDKEDWKAYAMKLKALLEEHNIFPPAFVRRSLEDSDEMKAITQAQIEKYMKKEEKPGGTTS